MNALIPFPDIQLKKEVVEAAAGEIGSTSPFAIAASTKEKAQGPERKLVAFELDDRGIPRHDYDIVDGQGKKMGIVTSGTMSPSMGKGIGLGYVPVIFSEVGSKIHIQIRKNAVPATVVKLPFYKVK